MDIFGSGIPLGRWFGITVRLDIAFFIVFFLWMDFQNPVLSVALIVGLYGCILLHEFGHALAARWCDGEANDIVLWPFGGLAFCRPAWHPTAQLITSAAGPLVTLVLAVGFSGLSIVLSYVETPQFLGWLVTGLAYLNWKVFLFNLIPAFPMDGGRILRDILWYWLGPERATVIAVNISRVIAVVGGAWMLWQHNYWLAFMALWLFLQTARVEQVLAAESSGVHGFSIRERLKRGSRQRAFRQGVAAVRAAEMNAAFHRCTSCGRTEHDDPHLEFRICTDCSGGQEYCREHLDSHPHI